MTLQPLVGLGFTITLRHVPLGRTPLNEWSVRRRDLYLTAHNTHNINTTSGIRTHNPRKRAAADPRLRQLARSIFDALHCRQYSCQAPLIRVLSSSNVVGHRVTWGPSWTKPYKKTYTCQPSVTIRLLRPGVCGWPRGALPHLRWNCSQSNTHL